MKVLLDECIDRRFVSYITGHEVKTVPQMGRAAIENGKLLALAAAEFDVFVTVDRNITFQQNLANFTIPLNRCKRLRSSLTWRRLFP